MKKWNQKFNYYIFNIKSIYILGIIISYALNSTIEEVQMGLKEMAYSYYMRGKNIQYCLSEIGIFAPEDATKQNIQHTVCTTLATNVYKELLDINLPSQSNFIPYARENIGNPEVIAYSYINDNNIPEMKIYYQKEKNKYKIISNPSISDIIPLVKIGDILSYKLLMLLLLCILHLVVEHHFFEPKFQDNI